VAYFGQHLQMTQSWTITRELVLSIVIGLRKGLGLCRGMRRSLTEEQQFRVAEEIAAQLKLSNYQVEKGPRLEGHGVMLRGADKKLGG
jgi:hypothetical protein